MTLPAWLVPWKLTILGILAAAILSTITVQHFRITNLKSELHAESARRISDLLKYGKAQDEAAIKNLEQVRNIEAKQQQINKERSIEYQTGLADLRTRYERLHSANPATPRTPGSPSVPKAGPAPSGPDGTDELLLPSERLLRAQEIELQLMELQNWNREQAKVTPNEQPSAQR